MKFEDLCDGYVDLWTTLKYRDRWQEKAEKAAKGVVTNKRLYRNVQERCGVPWFVVGLIHQMEADQDFTTHLHNGDPLEARTTNEPAGRPRSGLPPFNWEASAADALFSHQLDQVINWPLPRIAFELERYNGFRSRRDHGINTPYLWSGTMHYEKGKFIRDNVWSSEAVSKQVGALAILRALIELDETVASALDWVSQPKPIIVPGEPTLPGDTEAVKPALDLEELQRRLSTIPLYPPSKVDGDYGPLSQAAFQAFLIQQRVYDATSWRGERLVIAASQALCHLDDIDAGPIDGLLGAQTRYALDVYSGRKTGNTEPETWRNQEETKPPRAAPPPQAVNWPSEGRVDGFYGDRGENQARLKLPYPLRLAWEPGQIVNSIGCHEKVVGAVERVLKRVLSHYGPDRIRDLRLDHYGGCLNVRKKRGGSGWSMHSWGIALDFDPDRNQLRWDDKRAVFARPEYEKWFELWEEEGAISLGKARNFDWMHVQFATV